MSVISGGTEYVRAFPWLSTAAQNAGDEHDTRKAGNVAVLTWGSTDIGDNQPMPLKVIAFPSWSPARQNDADGHDTANRLELSILVGTDHLVPLKVRT